MRISILLLVSALFFSFCTSDSKSINLATQSNIIDTSLIPILQAEVEEQESFDNDYDRSKCQAKIKQKIQDQEPIVVHIKVPLCDNENQGIVRVSKALGDGGNLNTNLYWGALYGMKTHFKKSKVWELLKEEKNVDDNILERVVFYSKYPSGANVYLVADAYRGDRMKESLNDYLKAISGNAKEMLEVDEVSLGINSNADLNGFNGHNGLMDVSVDFRKNTDNIVREATAIACTSFSYFDEYLQQAHAYPTLMTTNLLAPEAYITEAMIDAWVDGKTDSEIRSAAGIAYDKYQKCGVRGATNLFKSGW